MNTRWSLFCTMAISLSEVDRVWLFSIVDNEIAAVQKFKHHITLYGDSHIPHIFMTPTIEGEDYFQYYPIGWLEGRVNYYRQPVESA